MTYVRRVNGIIQGVFTGKQPGYAEERIAKDDPEVVAYKQAIEDQFSEESRLSKLEKRIAALERRP